MRELTDLLAICHLQPSAEMTSPCCPSSALLFVTFPTSTLVALYGELDATTADGLVWLARGGSWFTVVVDLSGLTFMDSAASGLLWWRGIAFWPRDWGTWCLRDRV